MISEIEQIKNNTNICQICSSARVKRAIYIEMLLRNDVGVSQQKIAVL
ncbi:uncharacterized protein (DUF169 family) [Chryseobacterium lathyri]|jgi:uncharacterized protein (DUF169 family)|uniref:Uncharacterized protein (DUF169 family) n=1 Tax=Chryseobacterium lathyri TaxID=395933 RepID=A0ABT9SNJ4_9FLAO|nr:uncharacterized protein (DUF169 family) [Chryseobacterium lathyri]MDQ0065487.1 uncharacterized protein (DUF169 family) [Chryseobacterium lathyri]